MLRFWGLFIDFSLALACDWMHVSGAPLLLDDNIEAPLPTHSYVCFPANSCRIYFERWL